jgi:hypothetical protein
MECSECNDFYCCFCGIVIEEDVQVIKNKTDYYYVNNHQCQIKNNKADCSNCNICLNKINNENEELSD